MIESDERAHRAVAMALDNGWTAEPGGRPDRTVVARGDRRVEFRDGGDFFLIEEDGSDWGGRFGDARSETRLAQFVLGHVAEEARRHVWKALDALEGAEDRSRTLRALFDRLNEAGVALARFAGTSPNSRPK